MACSTQKEIKSVNSFGGDVEFLKQFTPIITLSSTNGEGMIAVSPSLQGRVMTSTATGIEGISFGWINKELFSSRDTLPHMNAFGGEERFWLGPEGGQYALYFKPGDPFDFDHWQTPALIDTEPFLISEQTPDRIVFTREASLINYASFEFRFKITREIKCLPVNEPGVAAVAYQSINTIENISDQPWRKESGLLSIWLLGMLNPSEGTTVIIPFNPGADDEFGTIVNDDYFGKAPEDRLVIKDSVCYFRADCTYLSKIGLNPKRAKPVMGSYDAINKILTIVEYTKPDSITDYVNSKWEIQQNPYRGDVTNSYNDGPATPGAKPMGPFYELETSSPAALLQPGESLTHRQTTYHFEGDESKLNSIARKMLGVDLLVVVEIFGIH
jgi:hypothetical protein